MDVLYNAACASNCRLCNNAGANFCDTCYENYTVSTAKSCDGQSVRCKFQQSKTNISLTNFTNLIYSLFFSPCVESFRPSN